MLIIWLGDLDSSLSDIFDTKKPVPVKVSNQTNLLNLIKSTKWMGNWDTRMGHECKLNSWQIWWKIIWVKGP